MPVPEAHYPRCLRCNKSVGRAVIHAQPEDQEHVVVEYECHSQTVTQETAAGILQQTEVLAACTAFNEYTSGLMRGRAAD